MSATVSASGGELSPAQVAELRRWAHSLASNGADESLRAGAAAVVQLADEAERLRAEADGWSWVEANGAAPDAPAPDHYARLASELAGRHDPEAPALARAIRRLSADVAGLRGDPVELDALAAAAALDGAPPRRPRWAPLAVAGALLPAACLIVAALVAAASGPSLETEGPGDGALLGRGELATLELSVTGDPETLADARGPSTAAM